MSDSVRSVVNGGGVAVALVGFGVTRLLVAETLQAVTSLPFLLAGLVPLVGGLGLTVYGVVLAVGGVPRGYASTVARWCLLGTGAMLVVLLITTSDALLRGEGLRPLAEAQVLVANVLLGGAVGGVLTGDRAARNRRQRRDLRRRTNQALLVNRLLRHEVVNAATIIQGYATQLSGSTADREAAATAIHDAAGKIDETVEQVGNITVGSDGPVEVDVASSLDAAVERLRSASPERDVTYDGPTAGVPVAGSPNLDVVFRKLLAVVADDCDADSLAVELSASDGRATVAIDHDGRALPPDKRALLTAGEFPEYDDPTSGFDLQIVRLLVAKSGGTIRVADDGSTISVSFPPTDGTSTPAQFAGVPGSNPLPALAAGLLAGVVMGGSVALTSNSMVVIGSLYGVESPLVGWATHLFHSVVFAVPFAAVRDRGALRTAFGTPRRTVLAGLAWGATLWMVAAGVVMPLWLQVVGVAAPFPNLSPPGLASHLLWGGVLGTALVALDARRDARVK